MDPPGTAGELEVCRGSSLWHQVPASPERSTRYYQPVQRSTRPRPAPRTRDPTGGAVAGKMSRGRSRAGHHPWQDRIHQHCRTVPDEEVLLARSHVVLVAEVGPAPTAERRRRPSFAPRRGELAAFSGIWPDRRIQRGHPSRRGHGADASGAESRVRHRTRPDTDVPHTVRASLSPCGAAVGTPCRRGAKPERFSRYHSGRHRLPRCFAPGGPEDQGEPR